ncbi:MAG: cytochrome P450, partial [Cellvibrionales bacterium]|nr:cytochrome P450 [Cellvibrionales bacterium]
MGTRKAMDVNAAGYLTEPDNKQLDHIPGNYGPVPYLGNTIEIINNLYGFIDKNYKQYGEVSKIKLVGKPSLLVVGADNYQHIYLDPEKAFSAQMGYDSSLGNFYEGALLLRDFKDHKIQRRLFQTAFKNDQMRGYVDIINPLFQMSIAAWQNQRNLTFFPVVKKTLLDVGASVFIGVKEFGPEMDKLNEAFLNISEKGLMSLLRLNIPGLKFHKGKQGAKYLESYFRNIIPLRREGDGKDMLTFLAKETQENGEYYSDADIIPQASFLLFAAHDTTASTLNTLILKLAEMP